MDSFLDEQFKTYSSTLDSKSKSYNQVFTIENDAFKTSPKKENIEQRGCLFDAQGVITCTPWEISKDGYSFRSQKKST